MLLVFSNSASDNPCSRASSNVTAGSFIVVPLAKIFFSNPSETKPPIESSNRRLFIPPKAPLSLPRPPFQRPAGTSPNTLPQITLMWHPPIIMLPGHAPSPPPRHLPAPYQLWSTGLSPYKKQTTHCKSIRWIPVKNTEAPTHIDTETPTHIDTEAPTDGPHQRRRRARTTHQGNFGNRPGNKPGAAMPLL